jgi:NAD(P)-dependent dehydrogenase (short-subunit alcohol dehydrogenase family)
MTDLVTLKGHTIVVTGAAQGIGKAVSELVTKLGGAVIALDLNGDALRAAVKSLPCEGVMPVVGTVVDADLASRTIEEAVKRFGLCLANSIMGSKVEDVTMHFMRRYWYDVGAVIAPIAAVLLLFWWQPGIERHVRCRMTVSAR